MKWLMTAIVLALGSWPVAAELPRQLLLGRTSLKNAVVPVFVRQEEKPVAVAQVGRVFTDYQRRGFLHIGLLPMTVLEGVTIEIIEPQKTALALASLHDWLNVPKGGRLVEFRRLKITCKGVATHELAAARVRAALNGQWELLDGVKYQAGALNVESPRARLQVIGERAGALYWESPQPATNNLFTAFTQVAPPAPKQK